MDLPISKEVAVSFLIAKKKMTGKDVHLDEEDSTFTAARPNILDIFFYISFYSAGASRPFLQNHVLSS